MKTCLLALAAAFVLALSGCETVYSTRQLRSPIVSAMGANYSIYTPLQEANPALADYPGTVLAKGHDFNGNSIDSIVAHWTNAYDYAGILDFRKEKGLVVKPAEEIKETKELDGKLGLKILANFITFGASGKSVKKVTLKLGGTQRLYRIDETTFNRLRRQLKPDFADAMRFRIAKKQTDGLMVVIASISTEELSFDVEVSSKAEAELAMKNLQKITPALKNVEVEAKVSAKRDHELSITARGEFLVAYQAIKWSDTILSTLTSAPDILFADLRISDEELRALAR